MMAYGNADTVSLTPMKLMWMLYRNLWSYHCLFCKPSKTLKVKL